MENDTSSMNDENDYPPHPVKNEEGYYDDEHMQEEFDNGYGYSHKIEDGNRYEEDEEQYEEEGEEEQDPYMNMSIEELKERLPAYMFKSEEEKVEYFKELNKSYYEELNQGSDRDEEEKSRKNVNFSGVFKIRSKFPLLFCNFFQEFC